MPGLWHARRLGGAHRGPALEWRPPWHALCAAASARLLAQPRPARPARPHLEREVAAGHRCAGLVREHALVGQVDGAGLEARVRLVLRPRQLLADLVLHPPEVHPHARVLALLALAHGAAAVLLDRGCQEGRCRGAHWPYPLSGVIGMAAAANACAPTAPPGLHPQAKSVTVCAGCVRSVFSANKERDTVFLAGRSNCDLPRPCGPLSSFVPLPATSRPT